MEGKRESEGDGGVIATWMSEHRQMYVRATRHPFILAIKDGSVGISSFKRWLGQDYLFVREFVLFVASVLLKASKVSDDVSDLDVILGGVASLHDEISWFKKEASKWDVQLLNVAPQTANKDYCRFLESIGSSEVEYTVAVTAFWAIEVVYQESFSLCLERDSRTPQELLETCQRWGNDGFRQYCDSLRQIANRCLEKAPETVVRKAEDAFLRVLELEVRFWDMSNGN